MYIYVAGVKLKKRQVRCSNRHDLIFLAFIFNIRQFLLMKKFKKSNFNYEKIYISNIMFFLMCI